MLTLYNSLTNQKEEFTPIKPGLVTLYSCGPTVYDHVHIGNLRAFLLPDLLQRVLRHIEGTNVTWVMNITDVDDKMIERAARDYPDIEPNQALAMLADKFTDVFTSDIAKVGVVRGDIAKLPRATDNIESMQEIIRDLISKGIGYVADGSVYFSLERYQASGHQYGCLVNLDYDGQSRVIDDQDQKQGVGDFALWKAHKDGEPSWDFDIDGNNYPGRPGWHIECSLLSIKYLGKPFDIHTGGVDLKFPHHENELAQCEGEQAHYYLHNEHVNITGSKMAKSAGNFITIDDVSDPLAYRLLCLQAHYRSQMDYSDQALRSAHDRLIALRSYVARNQAAEALGIEQSSDKLAIEEFKLQFSSALQDDLNSPQALAAFSKLEALPLLTGAVEVVEWADQVLGLDLVNKFKLFSQEEKALFDQRKIAREASDFGKADQIRAQLSELGIESEDIGAQTLYWRNS